MKKIIQTLSALLAVLLCLSFAGCGSEPKKPTSSAGESTSDLRTPGKENKDPSDEGNKGKPGKQPSGAEEGGSGVVDIDDIDDGNVCGPYPYPIDFHNYLEFARTYQALQDVSEEEFKSFHEDPKKSETLHWLSGMCSLDHARDVLTMVGNIPILVFGGGQNRLHHVEYSLYWDYAQITYSAGDGEHYSLLCTINYKTADGDGDEQVYDPTEGKEKICEFTVQGSDGKHIAIYRNNEWSPYMAVLDDPSYTVVFTYSEFLDGGLEGFAKVLREAKVISFFGEMEEYAA